MLNLKELRTKTNSTQMDLAIHLGISRPTYCRYEIGEREPNIEMLKKLASFFNVSVDYLINQGETVICDDIINQITSRISALNHDDRQSVIRYLDFIEKRNNS